MIRDCINYVGFVSYTAVTDSEDNLLLGFQCLEFLLPQFKQLGHLVNSTTFPEGNSCTSKRTVAADKDKP